jgi:hypothetical protein
MGLGESDPSELSEAFARTDALFKKAKKTECYVQISKNLFILWIYGHRVSSVTRQGGKLEVEILLLRIKYQSSACLKSTQHHLVHQCRGSHGSLHPSAANELSYQQEIIIVMILAA